MWLVTPISTGSWLLVHSRGAMNLFRPSVPPSCSGLIVSSRSHRPPPLTPSAEMTPRPLCRKVGLWEFAHNLCVKQTHLSFSLFVVGFIDHDLQFSLNLFTSAYCLWYHFVIIILLTSLSPTSWQLLYLIFSHFLTVQSPYFLCIN